MSKISLLAHTKQTFNRKRIFGFDIETCDKNKEFVIASMVGDNYKRFFYDKDEIMMEIRSNKIFRNSFIFATNLSFDFFGVYFNEPNFFTLFRGSDLLMAKTYIYNNNFYPKAKVKTKQLPSIVFLDSMNYVKMSVNDMAKIINMKKLEKPSFWGKDKDGDIIATKPKDTKEWVELQNYNEMDSTITYNFMKFFIDSVEKLGATFKYTIASTSMSLFKNRFLKDKYLRHDVKDLIEQFKCYYGGRTEAFSRGSFDCDTGDQYFYYDVNSLYPSVMRNNVFPDPNYHRITYENSRRYIDAYEGCSHVELFIFPCKYPMIPVRRLNNRVIFPYGSVKGWYTHIEIRKALELGAILKRVYKTHYFLKNCEPFKEYVDFLYSKRLEYKKDASKLEMIIKLFLNNLYGKLGQKFLNKDNWIHESMLDLDKHVVEDRKGKYIKLVEDKIPPSFCIPIWASYVTAYGRLKLHDLIVKHKPIYCDTDSIITKDVIKTSSELGELKLEMTIKKGVVVRPKFYAFIDDDNESHVKIKGLGKRISYMRFMGLLDDPIVYYNKFTRFKEALRRDKIPNEIIETHKDLSLNDEKRIWGNLEFDFDGLYDSSAIDMDKITYMEDKILDSKNKTLMADKYYEFLKSDLFDSASVGKDITLKEFLDNERRAYKDDGA